MSVINKQTGYYGFTLDGTAGGTSDNHGQVNRCMFAIVYPVQKTNVNFRISKGVDDWAARMGDGSIIPLSNPEVLYVNRDSAIVQFTMDEVYPANSPCILIYRSDSAAIKIDPSEKADDEFKVGHVTGNFAFTTNSYGGNSNSEGMVDKLLASFPYPVQTADIDFKISRSASHWGAHMGDGSIISLRDPKVITVNNDCATVVFTMDEMYASNSPCVIVYRDPGASISINPIDEETFIPVTDIIDVPSSMITGVPVNLSAIDVYPIDASRPVINWQLVHGDATISSTNMLIANVAGPITIKGTVPGGTDNTSATKVDFTKEFTINAIQNVITINIQPDENVYCIENEISKSISVKAESTSKSISYQWYRSLSKNINAGTKIDGATSSRFEIPTSLKTGYYYYFCKVSSNGAETITSSLSTIIVTPRLTGIKIVSPTNEYEITETYQLTIEPIPNNAIVPLLSYSSSNPAAVQVNSKGILSIAEMGSSKITVKTVPVDGKQFTDTLDIDVKAYVPVTDIINIPSEFDTDTQTTFLGKVVPNNASFKNIIWSILDSGDTGAVLTNNTIVASNPGTIQVRATINKGATMYSPFIKDFVITVNRKFVPVTDITINGIPEEYSVGDKCTLRFEVSPSNATNNFVSFTVSDAGNTGAILLDDGTLNVNNSGSLVVLATIENGLGNGRDYSKSFTIEVAPPFIPVANILGLPDLWSDVSKTIELAGSVNPPNATHNEIKYTLKSASAANVTMSGTTLSIDYQHITWWKKNPNPKDTENYSDQWIEMVTDPVVIEVRVKHGISKTEDFVYNCNIGIISPQRPDTHIPLTNISILKPSIVRARRPLLTDPYVKTPWNATNGNINTTLTRLNGELGVSMGIYPNTHDADYWLNTAAHININDKEYDWTKDCLYIFPVETGNLLIRFVVQNATADKHSLTINEPITVLPEYIPVAEVYNIPNEISVNSEINLYGECKTSYKIDNSSVYVYDTEIPSYSDVAFTVSDAGDTGATINDGVISFTHTGKCKIIATVESGLHEKYNWYNIHYEAKSFTQEFTINVVENEIVHKNPVVTLTLADGNSIKLYKESSIYNLSNDLAPDTEITVEGNSFRKNEVTEIKFWDDIPSSDTTIDTTIPVTNIELNADKSHWNAVNQKTTALKDVVLSFSDYEIKDRSSLSSDNTPVKKTINGLEGWLLPACDLFIKPVNDLEPAKIIQYDGEEEIDVLSENTINARLHFVKVDEVPFSAISSDEKFNYDVYDNGYYRLYSDDYQFFISKSPADSDYYDLYLILGEEFKYKMNAWGCIFTYANSEFDHIYLPHNRSYVCDKRILVKIDKIENDEDDEANNLFITSDFTPNDDNANMSLIEERSIEYILELNNYIGLVSRSIRMWNYREFGYDYYISLSKDKDDKWVLNIPGITKSSDPLLLQSLKTDYVDQENQDICKITNDNISGAVYSGPNKTCNIEFGKDTEYNELNGFLAHCDFANSSTSSILYKNYISIDKNHISISPIDATKNASDIIFTLDDNETGAQLFQLDNSTYRVTAGNTEGNILLESMISNGCGLHNQNYKQPDIFSIGEHDEIMAVSTIDKSTAKVAFRTNYDTTHINLSAKVLGINLSGNESQNIEWSISGMTKNNTGFKTGEKPGWFGSGSTDIVSKSTTGSSATVSIAPREKVGSIIKVIASYDGKSTEVDIYILSKYNDTFNITSLSNFARNFTSLVKLDRIPETVTGDGCLRNFLKGCTSFNQKITLHDYIEGTHCLEGFLSDCTSFNQPINIPARVTGERCLSRFLENCTSFNQVIVLPSALTGDYCMLRFLAGCTSFNQVLNIPDTVTGTQCLDHCLANCTSFNSNINLPNSLNGTANIRGFMKDTINMTATITVPASAAENAQGNALTIVCFERGAAYNNGITISGDGANKFKEKFKNRTGDLPVRKFI